MNRAVESSDSEDDEDWGEGEGGRPVKRGDEKGGGGAAKKKVKRKERRPWRVDDDEFDHARFTGYEGYHNRFEGVFGDEEDAIDRVFEETDLGGDNVMDGEEEGYGVSQSMQAETALNLFTHHRVHLSLCLDLGVVVCVPGSGVWPRDQTREGGQGTGGGVRPLLLRGSR